MKETLRLFKALKIKDRKIEKVDESIHKKTIKKGFIFSPKVIANYSKKDLNDLINVVEDVLGYSLENINNSFHKSWEKVATAPMIQLVVEQIFHYITTYGFKELGCYNDDTVFIPYEKLDVADLKENIKLKLINGYTINELKDKLARLMSSGIALKEDTVKDIASLFVKFKFDKESIHLIKNKEIKIALYEYFKIVPKNPVEFLRYIIFKTTGNYLLIKNASTIENIKLSKNVNVHSYFRTYEKNFGLKDLASCFNRFKPLFLAFKVHKNMSSVINKISRLSKVFHIPMKEDLLNTITSKIKKNEKIDFKKFENVLNTVNTFRKIRLAYALKYRTKDINSILYKIRNGKAFSTTFDFKNKKEAELVLQFVLKSIANDLNLKLKDKKIYIPDNIEYALPSTEKQFTGDFPSGTYVKVDSDMIFGIHWLNVDGEQIDLDLSIISNREKFGWDDSYRSADNSILFSGDMTNAKYPKGASELFYIKKVKDFKSILLVNYYNYSNEIEVPFKIVIGKNKLDKLPSNYMIDPNKIVVETKSIIKRKQKILGLVSSKENESRFYFCEFDIGNSITSSYNDYIEHTKKYIYNFYTDSIYLRDILKLAKIDLVNKKEDADIDLSPEIIEKDTIINMLTLI